MTLEIMTRGDALYKKGYNEKEALVQELYDSLAEFQQNPNNRLYRFLFGKVFNNLTASERLGNRSKTLRVYPHRLSGDQVRFLKRARKLAAFIEVPLAEVIGACGGNFGILASVPSPTIVYLGKVLSQVDELSGRTIQSMDYYRLEALKAHVEGLEDCMAC